MLKVRIITAVALAVGLWISLFVLPLHWGLSVMGAAFLVGAWEWAGFAQLNRTSRLIYSAVIGLLMFCAWVWSETTQHLVILMGTACVWWLAAFSWVGFAPQWQNRNVTLGCGVIVLVPAYVGLARMHVDRGVLPPMGLVLSFLLLVFAADVGAYFVGRWLGRQKLAPRVSPGKTREGAMGGLALVLLVAWAGAYRFNLAVFEVLGLACIVGVFSIVGDLTESMFKRAAGLKDSGRLLPGHGGVLDRIDSVTAAAPFFVLGVIGLGVLT